MAVYAISDLHGHLDLYKKVAEFLKSDDTVICLGDCGDRGPQSWETIVAVANDKRFKYLKGNHEDILVATIKENYLPDENSIRPEVDYYDTYSTLCMNGGYDTLEGWKKAKYKTSWATWLSSRPLLYKYVNSDGKIIVLSHAGPSSIAIGKVKRIDVIWDRPENNKWRKDARDIILVHGHTPIQSLTRDLDLERWDIDNGAFTYCGGHKIDIDPCTPATGKTILLNLDTFESKVFSI